MQTMKLTRDSDPKDSQNKQCVKEEGKGSFHLNSHTFKRDSLLKFFSASKR